MRQALAFRKDVRRRPLISVHLRDIEHRECPGEHASMVVVVTAVIIGLPGGRNLPPQHDSGGAFALAYLRAGILPLFVGSPEAVAIFSGEASRPKRQRVDPSVAFAGCDIGRAGLSPLWNHGARHSPAPRSIVATISAVMREYTPPRFVEVEVWCMRESLRPAGRASLTA